MATANPGYPVIRSTLLSRKPKRAAIQLMFALSFLLTFLSQASWFDIGGVKKWMSASPDQVFNLKEYWRAWTTVFVHADMEHLLSNVFLFFILGIFLTSYFGLKLIPLNALLFGGITNLIVLSAMPMKNSLIGASGVVFWMGGAWLTLFFLIDRRRSVTQRALRSVGVAIMLFVPSEAFDPNISYKAHFIGFFLGVAWALPYFFLNKARFRNAERIEWVVEEEDSGPVSPAGEFTV